MVVFENILKHGQFYLVLFGLVIASLILKIIAGPLFVVLIFLLWKKDRWTEILIVFSAFLIMSDSEIPSLGWVKSFKNIMILEVFALFYSDRKRLKQTNSLFLKFLPFIIISFIALYASVKLESGLMRGVSYLLLFIMIPNIVSHCYKENGWSILEDLTVFYLMVLILSVFLKYFIPSVAISEVHGGRMMGVFGNPNGLGLFVILTFIFFHVSVFGKKISLQWYWLGLFYMMILMCALWTGSRNCLMSILVFVVLSQAFKYSSFIGIVFFVVMILFINPILNFLVSTVQFFGLGESLRIDNVFEGSGRIVVWRFAWMNIQEYYLLGRGWGYDLSLIDANRLSLSKQGHEGGVHNTYLIMWLNSGLIGLIAFFRGFFTAFIGASKNSKFAFPFMFAVLTSISFEPWLAASLNPYTTMFLVLLTLMIEDKGSRTADDSEHSQTTLELN